MFGKRDRSSFSSKYSVLWIEFINRNNGIYWKCSMITLQQHREFVLEAMRRIWPVRAWIDRWNSISIRPNWCVIVTERKNETKKEREKKTFLNKVKTKYWLNEISIIGWTALPIFTLWSVQWWVFPLSRECESHFPRRSLRKWFSSIPWGKKRRCIFSFLFPSPSLSLCDDDECFISIVLSRRNSFFAL